MGAVASADPLRLDESNLWLAPHGLASRCSCRRRTRAISIFSERSNARFYRHRHGASTIAHVAPIIVDATSAVG